MLLLLGLWRGTTAALSRVMVGSAAQLSTFSNAKEYFVSLKVLFVVPLYNFYKCSFFHIFIVTCIGSGCFIEYSLTWQTVIILIEVYQYFEIIKLVKQVLQTKLIFTCPF